MAHGDGGEGGDSEQLAGQETGGVLWPLCLAGHVVRLGGVLMQVES